MSEKNRPECDKEEKMEKVRGFEIAKGFEDKQINLPIRKTKYSAGYDIEAAEDVVIPSFKKPICRRMKCYFCIIEVRIQRKKV